MYKLHGLSQTVVNGNTPERIEAFYREEESHLITFKSRRMYSKPFQGYIVN